MNKEPTLIREPIQDYGELYCRKPLKMTLDPDLTLADHIIYEILDILAGKRGWWYGQQEDIFDKAIQRLTDNSDEMPKGFQYFSIESVKRAVKKLRDKGYIVTEKMGLKMDNVLRYYIVFRHPKIPMETLRKRL